MFVRHLGLTYRHGLRQGAHVEETLRLEPHFAPILRLRPLDAREHPRDATSVPLQPLPVVLPAHVHRILRVCQSYLRLALLRGQRGSQRTQANRDLTLNLRNNQYVSDARIPGL